MAYETRHMKCCGLNEIHGLNRLNFSAAELMKWICIKFEYAAAVKSGIPAQRRQAGRSAFILTYAYDTAGGIRDRTKARCDKVTAQLKAYVTRFKLGEITQCPDAGNPNYEGKTMVRTLVFTPDQEAMLAWCEKKELHLRLGINNRVPSHNFWIDGS